MPLEKFCSHQMYARGTREEAYGCSPEHPEAQLFCSAHLNEGRAFPCPNTREDIREEEGRFTIRHREGGGICEDFEVVPDKTPRHQ